MGFFVAFQILNKLQTLSLKKRNGVLFVKYAFWFLGLSPQKISTLYTVYHLSICNPDMIRVLTNFTFIKMIVLLLILMSLELCPAAHGSEAVRIDVQMGGSKRLFSFFKTPWLPSAIIKGKSGCSALGPMASQSPFSYTTGYSYVWFLSSQVLNLKINMLERVSSRCVLWEENKLQTRGVVTDYKL